LTQGPGAHSRSLADIKCLKHRVDAHAVAVLQPVLEPLGQTVDQDHLDLGVWDSERLNDILDRWATLEFMKEVHESARTRK
jgi:hypothetical protein